MKLPDQQQIDKCLFGIIDSLDALFEPPFLYTPTVSNQYNGTTHPRPAGYLFLGAIDVPDKIQTFERKHMGLVLAAKPHEAVLAAGDWRCMEGRLNSFSINHWRDHAMALITATDRTIDPTVWVAFISVDKLPTINLQNTAHWKPCP